MYKTIFSLIVWPIWFLIFVPSLILLFILILIVPRQKFYIIARPICWLWCFFAGQWLKKENNPPDVSIEFFKDQKNIRNINCFSDEGPGWKKTKITFLNIEKKNENNFERIIGKFYIETSNGKRETLKPELRIYNQPNIITSEADIKTNLLTDKFMTMNIVQNKDYFNIRYQIKPFMIWIWISVLLISLGGFLSLIQKRYEK